MVQINDQTSRERPIRRQYLRTTSKVCSEKALAAVQAAKREKDAAEAKANKLRASLAAAEARAAEEAESARVANAKESARAAAEAAEASAQPSKHPLAPTSEEYNQVATGVLETVPGCKILCVYKINHPKHRRAYKLFEDSLLAKGRQSGRNVSKYVQPRLYHGTDESTADLIIRDGFDRSFCGKNATAYGKGVYFGKRYHFHCPQPEPNHSPPNHALILLLRTPSPLQARDASYSASSTYSVPDARGVRRMFQVRVAVGEWCLGKYAMKVPDVRVQSTNERYESTVNDMHNPGIWVAYKDSQALPEYLIEFKK